ncbi:CLUMA_CG014968, isoform A [Clunio marinus]|uniref:CLUMA_CG014968, isoform A n=1 Tax=Clunio marinus TaxID=568069 RepID=A0A1J1INK8_9DIPT|nr:CLUMA_CG014968, isoform A [Clunio marinus]
MTQRMNKKEKSIDVTITHSLFMILSLSVASSSHPTLSSCQSYMFERRDEENYKTKAAVTHTV